VIEFESSEGSLKTAEISLPANGWGQRCYDLNEFNSGCNERQRLEGKKGIINELVKRKEYRSITTLLIRLGLPRVTINGVGLSNYDRGV
jgi:hypothetical protein